MLHIITLDFLPSTFSPILYSSLFLVKYNTFLSAHRIIRFLSSSYGRPISLLHSLAVFRQRASLCFSFLRRLRYRVFFIELLIKTRPLYRPPVNCSLLRDRRFRRITPPFHDNPPFPRRRELTSTSVTADLPSFCLLHMSSTH